MAWAVADRVKETTTTTGTGAVTLAGAVAGFRAFSTIAANGDRVFYAIVGSTEWEVGYGTWSTGGSLSRDTVLASSNSGALTSFSAGSKDVLLVQPAMQVQLPLVARSVAVTAIVPGGAGAVVPDDLEIAAGQTLEIEADGVMEIT